MKKFNCVLSSSDYMEVINNVGTINLSERYVELPLGLRFLNYFSGKILEVGAVLPYHWPEYIHPVVDPYDIKGNIKQDAEDYSLIDKNVLSISTIEHMGEVAYGETKKDDDKPNRFIKKLIKESKNFLFSIPIGWGSGASNKAVLDNIDDFCWFAYIRDEKYSTVWNYTNDQNMLEKIFSCRMHWPHRNANAVFFGKNKEL